MASTDVMSDPWDSSPSDASDAEPVARNKHAAASGGEPAPVSQVTDGSSSEVPAPPGQPAMDADMVDDDWTPKPEEWALPSDASALPQPPAADSADGSASKATRDAPPSVVVTALPQAGDNAEAEAPPGRPVVESDMVADDWTSSVPSAVDA